MLHEPLFFGEPISAQFLYFLWYSFLGWVMETCYCSLAQRRFVVRGFLKGPICPIYGFGVMIMVLFFSRLTDHLLLFYVIATITMSAWEYFVSWLLEVTTHMRYWDYSHVKFNLNGRIRLDYCLFWGIGAYLAVFIIHPATTELFSHMEDLVRQIIAVVLAVILLADTVVTLRSLTMTTIFMEKARAAHNELERRRAELTEASRQRMDGVKVKAALLQLELKEQSFLADAAFHSRRFRRRFGSLKSVRYDSLVQRIRSEQQQLKDFRDQKASQLRELKTKVQDKL